MGPSREAFPQEELQTPQPRISPEAMQSSLLNLHTPDSPVGQEVERAYKEASEGNAEYLVELYEKQQEQLDRYAEDELVFFGNILHTISTHWDGYFDQQQAEFQEYQKSLQPLFDGCQGRFADLVHLHEALTSVGKTEKTSPSLKEKLQRLIEKFIVFYESEEGQKQDAQLFLTDVRLKLDEIIESLQGINAEEGSAASEEDVLEYYDTDDTADDNVADSARTQSTTTADVAATTQSEDVKDAVGFIVGEGEESSHEVADIMTRITEDEEQMLLWKKMIHHGFFRGLIHEQEPGVFKLSLTHQVLPWCGIPSEEFFEKNKRYYDLFPEALAEVTNPKTGEHFPEAVFLDESGYALRYFLQDRWDEYLRTPQYRTYYYHFVDQQVPFAA